MRLIIGRGRDAPDIESQELLWVNNCGAYIDWGKNKRTLRPAGRSDWQMIFITQGRGVFTADGQNIELGANSVVIYPPHVRQEYRFFSCDAPSFWWVHFSGREAGRLTECLCKEGQGGLYHLTLGDMSGVLELLWKMQAELSRSDDACSISLCGMLCELVGMCKKEHDRYRSHTDEDIERVCAYMRANYAQHGTLDMYAALAGMSKYHFCRRFARYTGMPPLGYVTDIRMKVACDLLSGGELSVGECSQLLGYTDQFYFCRVFTKHIGVSPAKYMKK